MTDRLRRSSAVLLTVLLFGGAGTALGANRRLNDRGRDPQDPTTLLVKFKDPADAATKVKKAGDTPVTSLKTDTELVKIQPGESVDAKVREYGSRNDVVYAEPNFLRSLDLAQIDL